MKKYYHKRKEKIIEDREPRILKEHITGKYACGGGFRIVKKKIGNS